MKKYYVIAATLLLALVNPNAHAMNKRKGDALEQPGVKKTRKKRSAIERTIPCPYCPDMCANNQTLSKHINAEHLKKHQQALADAKKVVQQALIAGTAHELLAQNSPAPAPTVPCPTCPRKFASAQGLGVHKKYCTAEDLLPKTFVSVRQNLVCGNCPRKFVYENAFRFHVLGCAPKVKAPVQRPQAVPTPRVHAPFEPGLQQQLNYSNSQPAFDAPEELFPELKYDASSQRDLDKNIQYKDERNYL